VALALLVGRPPQSLIAQAPAPIIDTIVVLNHNIFDERDIETPSFLTRAANAVHVRTSARVIRRALLLNQGDPYDSARAVESERALRSLNVFRQVQVDTVHLGSRLALRVQTADGWSTKPQFNFSTSGGSVTWQVGMEEENLLGTATSLTAMYSKTPDRSSGRFLYVNPHFLARRPRLSLTYQPLSDGRRGSWSLAVPFYQTAARYQIGTSGDAGAYRVLIFRDDSLVDSTQRHSLKLSLGGGMALRATSRSYLRLWGAAVWRREDFAPETTSVVPRSNFGTVGLGIEVARTRFNVLQRFNTYARREDVNLSEFLRLGLWVAPRWWGYPAGRAGVGPEVGVQLSTLWPGGFIVLRGNAHGIYGSDGLDSARARGGVTIASQNFVAQTLILHVEGGASRRVSPNTYFDTWLDQTGPRLFPAHAFTGTRTVWVAFEDRIVLTDEAMGLWGAGLAPFFDWGGAWFEDEPMRTGSDAGVALRLGPTRAVRGEVTELAVGYRFGAESTPAGWALSIRRGIAF
jgi:hypothetical protein